jgi:hypothetical protein
MVERFDHLCDALHLDVVMPQLNGPDSVTRAIAVEYFTDARTFGAVRGLVSLHIPGRMDGRYRSATCAGSP